MKMDRTTHKLLVDGLRIETALIDTQGCKQTIVLLHEGLGSIELWKNFPAKLAESTGCRIISYSRLGHGRSDAPTRSREICYLQHEAEHVLPLVLDHFELTNPILFGHSDGASIALLYAGKAHNSSEAIIVEAPHLFVEDITLEGIREASDKFANGLEKKLSRYHNDAHALFSAWHDTWLTPEFKNWNIEEQVKHVRCPVLAIQGENDQYGTLEQVFRIKELAPQTELYVVADCGHSPHQENPNEILLRVAEFLHGLPGSPAASS